MSSKRFAGLAAVLGAVLIASAGGLAALGGTSGVRIPYSGVLHKDGGPVSGTVDMTFRVYNAPATVEGDPPGSACYTTATPVQVSAGAFSVVVGPVSESCVRNLDVYLMVSVDDGTGLVALPGSQRVFPAVAASSTGSGDFDVGGVIEFGSRVRQMVNLWGNQFGIGVQGSTLYQRSSANFAWYKGGAHNDAAFSPGGGTSLMTLDTYGNLNVAGSLVTGNGIRLENNWSDTDGATRASKSAIANDTAGYKALMLVGNSAGGTRQVNLYDDVYVNGDITVPAGAALNMKHTSLCDCENSGDYFLFSTTAMYQCPNEKVMVGIYSTGSNGGCDAMHCLEYMRCCRVCGLSGY